MICLQVQKAQEGKELFDVLIDTYPDFPQKAVGLALKRGLITINGEEAFGDDKLRDGDTVNVFVSPDVVGVDLAPRIVYQDENIIIADKPAGLPCICETDEPSVISFIEEHMRQRGEHSIDALMVPYLIYALDEYVSGLSLIAKHEDAYMFFMEAIAQRRISRYYICPVRGHGEEQEELMGYHLRDKSGRRAQILPGFKKDSKPIVTRYKTLAKGDAMSLLCVRPVTNTLHQVRAHLSYSGLPILGDNQYGDRRFNKRNGAEYICLWLETLVFEVGSGHGYDYINGQRFDSHTESFPKSVYDQGLMDIFDEE